MFDTSAAGHDFNIDNGTFVVDASANRVGIGTATPSTLLDVNGALTATTIAGTLTTAAQTNITSVGTLSALNVGNITSTGNLSLNQDGANIYIGADLDLRILHDGSNGTFRNDTGDLTLDIAGELIIDTDLQGSGNGILLKDAGTLYGSIFRSSSHLHIKAETQDKNLLFLTNNGGSELTAMTIQSDGKVGIGESSPGATLHIKGSSGNIYGRVERASASQGEVGFWVRGGTAADYNWYIYQKNNGSALHFYNQSDRLTIDSSGTVGIGTTSLNTWTTFDGRIRAGARGIYATTSASNQMGYNWYYDGVYKYIAADTANRYYQNGGNQVWETAASGSSGGTITWSEKMRIDSGGKIGIGISPTHSIDLRAQYQPSGGIALNLHTDGGAWIQQKSTLSGVGSYQIGPGGDDWCVYDNTSSEYQIRVRDNANHKGSLQHKCHAHFQPHVSGSDAGQDEKGALAGAVYRLHNARIAPGQYSNNTYYVGVGRHYNKTTAFVEFKVNYVKASTAKCSFTGNNSADSQTRRVQLYWSLDGRRYTLGNTVSFGSGQATASYELTTNMISNTDSTFSGSIYWRCYLIDNASVHETLIGWKEFTFAAFAESMTFDGGFEQGVPDARKDQVTRAYGNVAGTEINYVPTSRPYGHTFTGAANVAVSSNAAYQQFTNKSYGYLNEDLMKIVTTPVHGIQILAEGQIMYSFNQDIITTGSTGYAYCQVRRHDYNNSNSAILGYHLITNTNGQWDMITGQGIFDVRAGDIISFYFGATNITNMDGGNWSYYNILWWPVTVTGTGNVGTGLAWAGEDAS